MDIKTKFNIGDTVWHFSDYSGDLVKKEVESIDISVSKNSEIVIKYVFSRLGLFANDLSYENETYRTRKEAVASKYEVES